MDGFEVNIPGVISDRILFTLTCAGELNADVRARALFMVTVASKLMADVLSHATDEATVNDMLDTFGRNMMAFKELPPELHGMIWGRIRLMKPEDVPPED